MPWCLQVEGPSLPTPLPPTSPTFLSSQLKAAALSDVTPCPSLPSGGVGFDINCGVRLLRTNLDERDVQPVKEQLAQSLFDHIPVGVGSKGVIPMGAK